MAAVTPSVQGKTEFAGATKLVVLKGTLTTASDTITLTAANCGGVISIVDIVGATITTGATTTFQSLQVAFSGLVITIVSLNGAGSNATTWGDIRISLIINTEA